MPQSQGRLRSLRTGVGKAILSIDRRAGNALHCTLTEGRHMTHCRSALARSAFARLLVATFAATLYTRCASNEGPPTSSATPTPTATPAATPTPTPLPASCSFSDVWSSSSQEHHAYFDPIVVDPRVPQNVAVKVKTMSTVDTATLELETGERVSLRNFGPGLFCEVLSPSQTLFHYTANNYQHNLVGFLNLNQGSTRLTRLNMYVNVADSAVPDVSLAAIDGDTQASDQALNIRVLDRLPSAQDMREVAARRFYQLYSDAYDFLAIVSVPDHTANRNYVGARNDAAGIGVSLFDNSAYYGSKGRLQGLVRFPILYYFNLAEKAAVHEIGHRWSQFLRIPALQGAQVHWPVSSVAYGINGFNLVGGQGGDFNYRLVALGNGDFRLEPMTRAYAYNDVELYLMGLIPAEQVGTHTVIVNQNQTICDGCVLKGPGVTFTAQDIIATHGQRVPSSEGSQREFRIGTIVVSTDRLLGAREMAFVSYFAARGEATQALPFTSGGLSGTTLPFALATANRAKLVTQLGPRR